MLDVTQTKRCNNCGDDFPTSEFYKDRSRPDGLDVRCKPCAKAKKKDYYARNTDRVKASVKAYKEAGYVPSYYRDRKSRFRNLLTNAKLRKQEFDPTLTPEYLEQLWEEQDGKCNLSGRPLTIEANSPDTVSLDRIDSSKGYVRGNLQLVASVVNRMKMDMSNDEFIHLCGCVSANQQQQTTR